MIYHVAFRGGGRDTERGVELCGWLCDLCETRTRWGEAWHPFLTGWGAWPGWGLGEERAQKREGTEAEGTISMQDCVLWKQPEVGR